MGELSQIIKLDATDSTNLYLRNLMHSQNLSDYTVVVTQKQVKGRGQMGTSWQSESGKNLTFSVLKRFNNLPSTKQFNLNICVSRAVTTALQDLNIPDIKVKWPNDIMSGSSKICGILIENVLKGHDIQNAVIGIGLNVNQTKFPGLDKVASLKLLTGKNFDLEEVLQQILEKLKLHLSKIEEKMFPELLPSYEAMLFRKDKPSTFKDQKGNMFMGFIRGVSPEGQLIVELEDKIFQTYGLKEVS
ncbi:MAG: biotin--[acetyl-CoA-carboxylase] ligase, partial [Bacteroidota bacterium]